MIARYPDDRLAIVVLANTAGVDAGGVERRIAKVVLGVEDKPVLDLPTDAELLGRFVGKYKLDQGTVEISTDEGKLYVKPQGQARDVLRYQGEQTFVSTRNAEIRIQFTPPSGRAEGFDLDLAGQKLSAKRAAEE
jgi:hypothetical protein